MFRQVRRSAKLILVTEVADTFLRKGDFVEIKDQSSNSRTSADVWIAQYLGAERRSNELVEVDIAWTYSPSDLGLKNKGNERILTDHRQTLDFRCLQNVARVCTSEVNQCEKLEWCCNRYFAFGSRQQRPLNEEEYQSVEAASVRRAIRETAVQGEPEETFTSP